MGISPVTLLISLAPLIGALLFLLSWLIQILTRIENRVTRLEVMVEHVYKPEGEKAGKNASTA
jgi:hypothetical protein